MKLNVKCIRDILIVIESLSNLDDNLMPICISINDFENNNLTKKYSKNEIVYTLKKLVEANFIIANFKRAFGCVYDVEVFELTYDGHQFLSSVESSKIFNAVMNKIDELGAGVTIEVLKALANKLIKEKLGL